MSRAHILRAAALRGKLPRAHKHKENASALRKNLRLPNQNMRSILCAHAALLV
jgi:hypothetical protein